MNVRRMKWINIEQPIKVTIYDEEHKEHLVKIMTIEEMIDTYTKKGCPTIYSNTERKKGKWLFVEYPDGYYHSECSICGHWFDEDAYLKQYKFCPNCGLPME